MAVQSLQENSGRNGGEGGLDLKALREARGLTVNDIYQATRISVANLESVENGEFKHLPPPIYTKAYINAYEKLLDIDAKQIIIRYDKYLAAVARAGEEEPCQLTDGGGFFSKRVVITASILAAFLFAGFYIYIYPNFQVSDAPTVASLSMKSQD
ncbi:MAG TPA: helix-turn-helix domain-containing protein, partial [Syntrophales bacterium]|nr:helix-turn-helix domain-containing protein [Syntrophales bacterium]